eukprot:3251341-Lingulodinium_polyedra.AAC.1
MAPVAVRGRRAPVPSYAIAVTSSITARGGAANAPATAARRPGCRGGALGDSRAHLLRLSAS